VVHGYAEFDGIPQRVLDTYSMRQRERGRPGRVGPHVGAGDAGGEARCSDAPRITRSSPTRSWPAAERGSPPPASTTMRSAGASVGCGRACHRYECRRSASAAALPVGLTERAPTFPRARDRGNRHRRRLGLQCWRRRVRRGWVPPPSPRSCRPSMFRSWRVPRPRCTEHRRGSGRSVHPCPSPRADQGD
jgi:hypothetical protein